MRGQDKREDHDVDQNSEIQVAARDRCAEAEAGQRFAARSRLRSRCDSASGMRTLRCGIVVEQLGVAAPVDGGFELAAWLRLR